MNPIEHHGIAEFRNGIALPEVDQLPDTVAGNNLIINCKGVIWAYTIVDGVAGWRPLTNEQNSHVHSQALPTNKWVVNHNLGTTQYAIYVRDQYGYTQIVSPSDTSENTFDLNFEAPKAGYCMVFATGVMNSQKVHSEMVTTDSIHVGDDAVVITDQGILVNGVNLILYMDARLGEIATALNNLTEAFTESANAIRHDIAFTG